jgi:hypothetical protein
LVPNERSAIDLQEWLLANYFWDWEVKEAENIRKSKGLEAAVRHLCQRGNISSRGYTGPGKPAYDTMRGTVMVWAPENFSAQKPDLEFPLEKLARLTLSGPKQPVGRSTTTGNSEVRY